MVEVSESTLSHMHALPEDVQECAIDPTGAFSARSRGWRAGSVPVPAIPGSERAV